MSTESNISVSSLPPLADVFDGDGFGSYDTDELEALEAASRERDDE